MVCNPGLRNVFGTHLGTLRYQGVEVAVHCATITAKASRT